MSKDNPFSTAAYWWKEHGPGPIGTAALLGALIYGKNRALWGPSIETLRSLGRPVGSRLMGGDADWNEAMDNLKYNSSYRRVVPAAFGLLGAAGALALMARPGLEGYGLTSWDAKPKPLYNDVNGSKAVSLYKTASYLTDSYVQDLDWMQPLDSVRAKALFTNDPEVQANAYARNMGLAIVNNAERLDGSRHPTLGRIFDSALDKFDSKLTVRGVTDVAVKSAVANASARLFTGALGAVCGMNDKARQALVDAGTWAGAITAILD